MKTIGFLLAAALIAAAPAHAAGTINFKGKVKSFDREKVVIALGDRRSTVTLDRRIASQDFREGQEVSLTVDHKVFTKGFKTLSPKKGGR